MAEKIILPNTDRIAKGLYWDRALKLVEGCSYVSPGCDHCWSAREANIRSKQKNTKIQAQYSGLTDETGKWNGKIRLMEKNLDLPLRTKKSQVWAVWNDLFHKDVPDWFLDKAFEVFLDVRASHHIIIILTKRHERMLEYTSRTYIADILKNKSNIIGMVTAENQHWANIRVPYILRSSFAVKGVSIEPMLGPVDLTRINQGSNAWINALTGDWMGYHPYGGTKVIKNSLPHLNWIACGGETDPGARPMHPIWVDGLCYQCKESGTRFFFKSWGEWAPWYGDEDDDCPCGRHCEDFCNRYHFWGYTGYGGPAGYEPRGIVCSVKVGKKKAGRLLNGRTWDEFPEVG